ncbi:MAG: glycosyltransferase [Pirellulales bacterium]|nr:glycosyltransferase [Pirellulales bacterium]
MRVRLLRPVEHPGRSGPWNGQYALQKALRARIGFDVPWLSIGGRLQPGELPWFWCWLDRPAIARWMLQGRPFVQGPNTLLLNSRRPRGDRLECLLLDTGRCRLMFTESTWYRDLLVRHRGPENRSPIVLWPYPIDPQPGGPLPPEHDLLLYVKNGAFPGFVERMQSCFRRSRVICYGRYQREELWEAARRSRCCCYLADDDRGPLALAEILLCGCPTVGLPTGAPFVANGRTGILLDRSETDAWIEAVENCLELDRAGVAALALEQFDTKRIVDVILTALDRSRND